MAQIDLFVEMCGVEQRIKLSGKLPSLESYYCCRTGASAVTVLLAIHE